MAGRNLSRYRIMASYVLKVDDCIVIQMDKEDCIFNDFYKIMK